VSALGFDRPGVVQTIESADRFRFVKMMTTFADHRLWQDVYHAPAGELVLYVSSPGAIRNFRDVASRRCWAP
jgi:motility quorum-sensing regulator/GCU-specific mRNA interferase toxin